MDKELTSNYFILQKHTSKQSLSPQNIPNNIQKESQSIGYGPQEYLHSKALHRGYDTSNKEKVILRKQNEQQEKHTQYRVSRVNIDSRYRNIETKNILDDSIMYLNDNPLILQPNSNIVRIINNNHGYQREDKIVLQGVQSYFTNLRNGLTFINQSNYIRINHINHNQVSTANTDITNQYIVISGVIGNSIKNTSLQNIPINEINKKHQIYFKRTNSDIPNANFYYIKIDTVADSDFDYNLTDINVYFLQLAGIPLNELNANYPVSINQLNGYHIVTNIVDKNTFEITTSSPSNTISNIYVGGDRCWVARVNDFIEGYPNNNYYKISLKKTFYNVKKIKLISSEFPNTERVIKNYPDSKKNNTLYWQLSDDGNQIYSIEITPGNYTISTLKEEIETKMSKIERQTLIFLNSNIPNKNYYYKYNIIPEVSIKSETDVFSLKIYENIIIQKPFTVINSIATDGFQRVRVFHPNHKLTPNDIIIIENAASTDNVPSEILNSTHIIEVVLDKDNYQIKLPQYNTLESEVTNGGSAVSIKYLIKFRLLFDKSNTIGRVLGFNKVGEANSISAFNKEITNNSPYENSLIFPQNNIINLSGDNYILMSSPLFKETYSSGPIDDVFAKLLLASDPGTIMYNQFVQLGEDFNIPINSLSEFEVSFYDPMGELFYFNNIEHSYTLEIYEDISQN